jgi:superfamily II DNA helicase RecQ
MVSREKEFPVYDSMYKFCPNCKENLLLELFGDNKNRYDGKQGICKVCRKTLAKTKYKSAAQKYAKGLYQRNSKVREQKLLYYQNNKEELIRKITERTSKRLRNDPIFRLTSALRARVRAAIKNQSGEKAFKTKELIGCEVQFLTKHIEFLWEEGMSWDNYGLGKGKWVIDHIIPCIKFNLLDPEQQKQCFHYSNMQPLWWEENAAKAAH